MVKYRNAIKYGPVVYTLGDDATHQDIIRNMHDHYGIRRPATASLYGVVDDKGKFTTLAEFQGSWTPSNNKV